MYAHHHVRLVEWVSYRGAQVCDSNRRNRSRKHLLQLSPEKGEQDKIIRPFFIVLNFIFISTFASLLFSPSINVTSMNMQKVKCPYANACTNRRVLNGFVSSTVLSFNIITSCMHCGETEIRAESER